MASGATYWTVKLLLGGLGGGKSAAAKAQGRRAQGACSAGASMITPARTSVHARWPTRADQRAHSELHTRRDEALGKQQRGHWKKLLRSNLSPRER